MIYDTKSLDLANKQEVSDNLFTNINKLKDKL